MALLDVGGLVLALSVSLLWLQVIGLPLVRGSSSKENLTRHGYLTAVAVALQTVLAVVGMLPPFNQAFLTALTSPGFPAASLALVWVHTVLGAAALVLGFGLVILWRGSSAQGLRCARAKRLMAPVFTVWVATVVTGASIHLLGLL